MRVGAFQLVFDVKTRNRDTGSTDELRAALRTRTGRNARGDRGWPNRGPVRRRAGAHPFSRAETSPAHLRTRNLAGDTDAGQPQRRCRSCAVVPRCWHLSPLPAGACRLRAFTWRVLHFLHAIPAGGEPRHVAGAVRVPEYDLPA